MSKACQGELINQKIDSMQKTDTDSSNYYDVYQQQQFYHQNGYHGNYPEYTNDTYRQHCQQIAPTNCQQDYNNYATHQANFCNPQDQHGLVKNEPEIYPWMQDNRKNIKRGGKEQHITSGNLFLKKISFAVKAYKLTLLVFIINFIIN